MAQTDLNSEHELGGHMSFLEHLDELRRRPVNSIIIMVVAFALCWFVSDRIYDFLSVPIRRALSEAARRDLPVSGVTGQKSILNLSQIKEGDSGRYIFDRATNLGPTVIAAGSSVLAEGERASDGNLGLFSSEQVTQNNSL